MSQTKRWYLHPTEADFGVDDPPVVGTPIYELKEAPYVGFDTIDVEPNMDGEQNFISFITEPFADATSFPAASAALLAAFLSRQSPGDDFGVEIAASSRISVWRPGLVSVDYYGTFSGDPVHDFTGTLGVPDWIEVGGTLPLAANVQVGDRLLLEINFDFTGWTEGTAEFGLSDGEGGGSYFEATWSDLPGESGGGGSDPVDDVDTETRSFARMLKQLLPRGVLWFLELGGKIDRVLIAMSDEFVRVIGRGRDLIEESDPRTATETLEDWERVLGLPNDQITEIPATDAGRRLAITQKLIRRGGQSASFYIALAAACGYTVTIDEPLTSEITRAGTAVAGDYLAGLYQAFRWEVIVQAPAGTALTHAELEAVFDRAKPAHTSPFFTYL